MWAVVLGLAGVAVVVYELWTRPKVAQKLSGALDALPPVNSPLRTYTPPVPKIGQAAINKCGLLATDLADADAWSANFIGPSLALPNRLNLMRSVVDPHLWPESARRSWCAFVNEGLV
jgi:hypothetical protein